MVASPNIAGNFDSGSPDAGNSVSGNSDSESADFGPLNIIPRITDDMGRGLDLIRGPPCWCRPYGSARIFTAWPLCAQDRVRISSKLSDFAAFKSDLKLGPKFADLTLNALETPLGPISSVIRGMILRGPKSALSEPEFPDTEFPDTEFPDTEFPAPGLPESKFPAILGEATKITPL